MALFKDLLKKWFYQNSSSAASSDARIPLLTSTGEPKGSDTMANISSVLGVSTVYNFLSKTEDGYPMTGWAYLITINNGADKSHKVEFLVGENSTNANAIYFRTYVNNNYGGWKKNHFG